MKCSREALLNALELVLPGLSQGVNKKAGMIEQSDSYIFRDGRVYAFNDEIASSLESPLLDFEGAVKAGPLREILAKMTEDLLDVSHTDSHLILKGKSRRDVGVLMEKEITIPMDTLEPAEKWKRLPDNFAEAVAFVQGCAGRDDSKFELTCIHITPDFIECFDNSQFARFGLKMKIKHDILMRQQTLKHITTLNMSHFSETKNWVHFRNEEKLMLSGRKYLDKYQNLNGLVKKARGQKVTLPKTLVDAAERAEVFSVDNIQSSENEIEVDLKPGWMLIEGIGQFGWYRERKKISDYEGEPARFRVAPQMQIQLVNKHTHCEVSPKALRAEVGSALFITSLSAPTKVKK